MALCAAHTTITQAYASIIARLNCYLSYIGLLIKYRNDMTTKLQKKQNMIKRCFNFLLVEINRNSNVIVFIKRRLIKSYFWKSILRRSCDAEFPTSFLSKKFSLVFLSFSPPIKLFPSLWFLCLASVLRFQSWKSDGVDLRRCPFLRPSVVEWFRWHARRWGRQRPTAHRLSYHATVSGGPYTRGSTQSSVAIGWIRWSVIRQDVCSDAKGANRWFLWYLRSEA